ncbi:MAG: Ig-like domain-containing protein, partial [Candidatus Thorarchaeota archaeon]
QFQFKHETGLWQSISSIYKFEIGGYWQSKFGSTKNTELGKYTIRVRYTNLNGSSTDWYMKSFTILNNLPIIEMPVPVFYGIEDNDIIIDLSIYETDIEDIDQNLKWQVIYYMPTKITKIVLTESPKKQISFSPKADWSGSTNVNFSLKDSDEGETWKNITLIWESENDPPQVISPIPDFSILEDHTDESTVKLDTVFFDIDDPSLNYSVSGNVHIFIKLNPDNTVKFNPEPNWTGKETIKFTARDVKGLETSNDVVVTITP